MDKRIKVNRKEYNKKWKKDNYNKVKLSSKKWKDSHPENQRKYREHFPWIVTFGNIIQRCTNPNNRKYNYYKDKLGDITKEELKEIWMRDNASLMIHPSIDRINNNGVYTKNNLQYLERTEHNIKTAQERRLLKLGVR